MTIKLGSFVLCDGADSTTGKLCGPSGLAIQRRGQAQVVYPVGATNAKIYDRKGLSASYSWTVVVRLASPAAAIAWVETFDTTCPSGGTLYFDSTAKGSGVLVFSIDPLMGCSVTIRFTMEVAR